MDSFSALLSIFKTFVSFLRGILPIILACIVSFAVCFVFFFPPSITFPVLWRLENECWGSCGLKGNKSERVDTWDGRKGLVSTAFKNGGRCKVMKLEPLYCSPPIYSYMASQSLTTFKNNFLMRWVNVWSFLSALSIKQPLCNSFYSLRTSSGGVTSTLVLHPLDLIKLRFQGKILGITWLRVTCKCLSNRKRFPCLQNILTPQPCLHTLMQTLLSANQRARTILVIL